MCVLVSGQGPVEEVAHKYPVLNGKLWLLAFNMWNSLSVVFVYV